MNLVKKAKADGAIDQKEIINAIPDTPANAEVLDELYTELADADVDIANEKVRKANGEMTTKILM